VVVRGGGQRKLKGHVYTTTRLDVRVVARRLPLRPSETPLRVVLTGAYTSRQQAALKKPYLINPATVVALLNFFRENNPLFADVQIDDDALVEINSAAPDVFVEVSADVDGEPEQAASAQPAGQETEPAGGSPDVEPLLIPNATTHVGAQPASSDMHAATATFLRKVVNNPPIYQVASSSAYVAERDTWLELAFPNLFPFGVGGFSQQRAVPVSHKLCCQHFLRLSSRAFQGWNFALHATLQHYIAKRSGSRQGICESVKRGCRSRSLV
jgi:hypothetical protein